jgi:hypothetical protein
MATTPVKPDRLPTPPGFVDIGDALMADIDAGRIKVRKTILQQPSRPATDKPDTPNVGRDPE